MRSTVASCLKTFGVEEVDSAPSSEQFLSKIDKDPVFVIIDWDCGEKMCLRVLEGVKKRGLVGITPIMIISAEMQAKVVSAGYEYSVSKVVIGEKTFQNIQNGVNEAFQYEQKLAPIRDILLKVKEAREGNNSDEVFRLLADANLRMPNVDRITVEYAEALINKSDWEGAGAILAPLVTKQPPYVRAQQSYARVLMKDGDLDQAKGLLTNIKLLNPSNVGCLVAMGDLLINEGDLDEARVVFDDALDVDPEAVDAKQGVGRIELIEGNIDDAMGILRDVSTPKELASIFNLSAIHNIKDRNYESAMKLYQYSIGLLSSEDKLQAKLYFNAGLGFRKWNMLKRAMQCFEKSIELDPEYDKPKRNYEAIRDHVDEDIGEDEERIGKATALNHEVAISKDKKSKSNKKKSKDPFDILGGMDSLEPDFSSFDGFDEDDDIDSLDKMI
jgi:tetratricopeptide (TPR) repeat protein